MIFLENHGKATGKRRRRHRNPKGRRAQSGSTTKGESMAARRSRSRKRSTRRKSRRAASVVHHNAPRRHAKRRGRARAHRNPPRSSKRRRGFRRNPGIVNGLMQAAGDGASVYGGVVVQNQFVRLVPSILPATMGNAALLNGLLADVVGIVGGSMLAGKVLSADRARMVVAGQTFAALARVTRAMAIPVLSTSLGEYDPMRLSGYVNGLPRGTTRAALPAPRANNVSTLKGVGIYADGMSSQPSMY